MSVRLGYPCENLNLGLKCNRSYQLATIKKKHISERYQLLVEKSLNNLAELKQIIEWHIEYNHKFFRVSSSMFPHISNPLLDELMTEGDLENYRNLEFAKTQICEIGLLAYQHGIRLTMHPVPMNHLGSPRQDVVYKTGLDLTWHARFFDLMDEGIENRYGVKNGMKNSVLCIHGGGAYGNKIGTLERWRHNFRCLPINVQQRIALENCEKNYSVQDLLLVCQNLNIPLIFDFFHYLCYDFLHPEEKQLPISNLLPQILSTWEVRGLIPKFHLSDQAPNSKIGKHADFVEHIPNELLQLATTGYQFDIMIEAKQKDWAMFYLLGKYPQFDPNLNSPKRALNFQPTIEIQIPHLSPFSTIQQLICENRIIDYKQRTDLQRNDNVVFEFICTLGNRYYAEVHYVPSTNQIFPLH